MTKKIIETFNKTETETENTFALNVAKVYAPFIKAVKEREIAFDMFKGEKGANAAKLAYDVQNGFRNDKGEYLVKGGLQSISQAKHFADYSVKDLQELKGATLGTAYKNVSIAKNADKPKRGKVTTTKQGGKDEGGEIAKPANIQEMAAQIVKTLGKVEAEKLSIAIYDLCVEKEKSKVA